MATQETSMAAALHPSPHCRVPALHLAVVLLLLAAACSSGGGKSATTTKAAGAPDLTFAPVVRAVEPSIVTLTTPTGIGSGVIYLENGTLITDEHVIHGAKTVDVAFADGVVTTGKVLASDALTDIALVQANRTSLTPAVFRKDAPAPGDAVIALGSPLGLSQTVTLGIVSALHRVIPGGGTGGQALVDLIQTDAPISPGNSGGALVDTRGRVVGINEAYLPPSTGAVSIGFATPTSTVLDVVAQLLASGQARHAYLGLVPRSLTPEVVRVLHVPVQAGVVVLSVDPRGPAAKAGVRPGDVIVELDGTAVKTAEDVLVLVAKNKPGDTVRLTLQRGPSRVQVSVVLTNRPL
jgi:serine protease DegQ